MKFFALLLFSLQFLAPALLVDLTDQGGCHDNAQLVPGARHQNIIYSIFAEEILENGESREGQKDIALFTDLDFASAFLQ